MSTKVNSEPDSDSELNEKSKHPFYEDMLALLTASLMISLGIFLFKYSGFLTGGTAGIALILTKVFPLSFGQVFFVINIPFYYLAWTQMGKRFTLNTFVSVSVVSTLTDYLHLVLTIEYIHPVFSAITGGFFIGMGMLILFRHSSSLGGVGILALYLQQRFKIRAGKFQMAVDITIVCVGFFLVPINILLLSVLGAFAMNLIIAINHKPGRYNIT